MRNDLSGHSEAAPAVFEVPSQCPTCSSHDVKTTSKVVNAESYWRCGACGEVWNAGRLRAASRYVVRRPFGR